MSTPLTDYLIQLSFEPGELARFQSEPAAAAHAAGLSAAQQTALISRDPEQITRALIAEHVGRSLARSRPPAQGQAGSLTVVGIGIQIGQTTLAARALLESADQVLFLTNDLLGFLWLRRLNATAESLEVIFQRGATYADINDRILACVRQGLAVCVAAYGHPGVLQLPIHEVLQRARAEGFAVRMLPALSAEDCLFADLGINPGLTGWQSYAATDFLVHGRTFDPASALILWQVGFIGAQDMMRRDPARLQLLSDVLQRTLDAAHEVVVYEAAFYPVCSPLIVRVPLGQLAAAPVTARSTLYVPPARVRPPDPRLSALLGGHALRPPERV